MPERRTDPYIWVTWLSKLLVGDTSCEWAAWFKAHFQDFQKVPSDFDTFSWQIDHTDLLSQVRADLEAEGYTVATEQQNLFRLRGSSGITVGGKPDLIVAGPSLLFLEILGSIPCDLNQTAPVYRHDVALDGGVWGTDRREGEMLPCRTPGGLAVISAVSELDDVGEVILSGKVIDETG